MFNCQRLRAAPVWKDLVILVTCFGETEFEISGPEDFPIFITVINFIS